LFVKAMATPVPEDRAHVGVSDHGGWAVLITVAAGGRFIDRRRVDLVDAALPKLPHHHDAQGLPVAEGVALVERVTRSAEVCARATLETLAATVPARIVGIALRRCQPLPATVAERLSNYRAQNVADWVMYRKALAGAAEARGWAIFWYDPRQVLADAANALGRKSIDDLLKKTGAALGPPWQTDHRQAMAAAIAAGAEKAGGSQARLRQ
jgi:hypothetical protein